MTLLQSVLLAIYLLGGAAIYFKFCHGRPDMNKEERFWSVVAWPLLVLAAVVFLLGLAMVDLPEHEQEGSDTAPEA